MTFGASACRLKTGNAVRRNRARRRLRALARKELVQRAGAAQIVIIARHNMADRPWADLVRDLDKALGHRIADWRRSQRGCIPRSDDKIMMDSLTAAPRRPCQLRIVTAALGTIWVYRLFISPSGRKLPTFANLFGYTQERNGAALAEWLAMR